MIEEGTRLERARRFTDSPEFKPGSLPIRITLHVRTLQFSKNTTEVPGFEPGLQYGL